VTEKTTAIKAQEKVVFNELIKYVELVASIRDHKAEDFIDYGSRRPAFLLVTASIGNDREMLMSSHVLSPASLRQEHLDPIEMKIAADYGRTSVAVAMAASAMKGQFQEIMEIAIEVESMSGGIGHA
jgi:hypothetical protein